MSPTADQPLRWGVLGAGLISHDWSAAVATLPQSEHKIVAVAARNEKNAAEFARTHGIPKVHKSYEDLAKDPEIDIIYVGVLHTEHLRISKMLLDNGKHILCEKPLCMNVRETKELVEYARKKKLFLMEAVWSRFFPAYVRLREKIAQGEIGEVVQVKAELGLAYPEDNWRRNKDVGGGTVLDMGTYCTQFTVMCFAGLKPEKILAGGHLNPSGSDDSSSTTIVYPGGKTASLITHSKVSLPSEALVVGTKGYIKLHFPFWAANKLETEKEIVEFPLPETKMKLNFWNSTGLAYQCEEVRRCLLNGLIESSIMSLDESILISEINESIRKQIGVVYPQDES